MYTLAELIVYHQAVLDRQKSGKNSYWPQVTVVKDEPTADVDESIWPEQTLRCKKCCTSRISQTQFISYTFQSLYETLLCDFRTHL
jgi:hypothetical protein